MQLRITQKGRDMGLLYEIFFRTLSQLIIFIDEFAIDSRKSCSSIPQCLPVRLPQSRWLL